MSSTAHYSTHGSVALIEMNNPPVNGLSLELRQAIVDLMGRALADDQVSAILLIGSERAFSGGADIREFGTPRTLQEPNLRTVIQVIEDSGKPVIAAIAGACMGGGLELALGCHFRVAKPEAIIALPEVKLGILPGAGGTQRLPRAVGVAIALRMIVSGDSSRADELSQTELFDEIVTGDLRAGALAFAEGVIAERRPLKRIRDKTVEGTGTVAMLAAAREELLSTSARLPAPLKCVEAVAATTAKSFEEGIKLEREYFDWLVATPQSLALRHVFAAERAAGKIPDVPADTPMRRIEKVGVVGAGTMGSGIAMSLLNAGLPVALVETSPEALDRGLSHINRSYGSSLKKGKLTRGQLEGRLALLQPTLDPTALADCDLIIEAVFEDMDLKRQVFTQLDAIARPGAILASNTSTLDLNNIAAATGRPEDVIGLHFFSPAHVMRLIEVVRGARTATEVLATCMQLAKRIKKVAVVSGVCDGFIGNRMLHRYAAVAEQLLVQGATPQQVDRALENFGMAMGPFRVGDLAGLDVGRAIRAHRASMNPALAVSRIADRLCEAGRLGQKTAAGWYRYEPGRREPLPDPAVEEIIAVFRNERRVTPRAITDQEIADQCIFTLVNEGAAILEEGVAQRASDIDIVFINGYGFPAYRGGPMHYANEVGLNKVVTALQKFASGPGAEKSQWVAAPLLARSAADGGRLA
jgi:3-hydroxyacyl-CoA dehydrogenase